MSENVIKALEWRPNKTYMEKFIKTFENMWNGEEIKRGGKDQNKKICD